MEMSTPILASAELLGILVRRRRKDFFGATRKIQRYFPGSLCDSLSYDPAKRNKDERRREERVKKEPCDTTDLQTTTVSSTMASLVTRFLLSRSSAMSARRPTSVQLFSTAGRSPLPPAPRVLPPRKKPNPTASTQQKQQAAEQPQSLYARTRNRGPVSWPALFLVSVAAASAVAYYSIERERRLERAMGQVVSSESDGWTPRPDYLAKRKFVPTNAGWFPIEDGFGARE